SVTFFVGASANTGTALQADQFAQQRIASYVGVLTSERLAKQILSDTRLPLTVAQVTAGITATSDPNTVLLGATVTDTNPQRSLTVATAIANDLGPMVAGLEDTSHAGGTQVALTVISGPTLDPRPVSPSKTLNLGIGILVGLTLGAGLAIARQLADTTVRSGSALQQVASVPVLALVALEAKSRRKRMPLAAAVSSPRAEAYRRLRTNLTFSNVDSRMQVIVVTSSLSGEGKSTTAGNLAMVLAEAGRPVLLLEADLRRPSLGAYLGVESSVGLTNVLAGQVDADDVIQTWGADGLHILASGTIPPNPSELLGSDRMRTLMTSLRGRFDVIVVDTPPLLPVTDAAIVATQADGVVLVARHATTHRDDVAAAVDVLRAVEAKLVGTVLNMTPEKASSRDGYHSYATSAESHPPVRAARRWTRRSAHERELAR
ncbi:MAG TPA: polysaccharide biosynthesis tyrosine autokinase, partial [Cellulomonadaceae bacterium]|nr:polysaccharide biosynthesis tyrosine autokinase [Cellulomonadaceae bacterium]